MNKYLLTGAGVLFGLSLTFSVVAPAQAAALTSAQVQAIVGLLQSFGADASIIANVQSTLMGPGQLGGSSVNPTTYTTQPATASRICPQIIRTIGQGDSGSDVSDLQGYLGVSQTGYFGPMTARAVASFQAEEWLSQVGIVGPQTRAAFARRCGGGGSNNAGFSASPTYGSAPLSVTFTITAEAGEYTVEFGDGQSTAVTMPAVQCFRAPCNTQTTKYHTYTSAGTYTARLMYQPPFYCPPGAMCPQMMPAPKQVGTVTVTVKDGTTATQAFSASPTSGAAPLTVYFGYKTKTGDSGQYSIEFGDGTSAQMQPDMSMGFCGETLDPICFKRFNASHTYTTNGTYTAKLTTQGPSICSNGICTADIVTKVLGTATITVTGGTSGGVPSINGLDAPTSLSAGQTGTWTVRASAPSGTQLSYYVRWGDEPSYAYSSLQDLIQTSATFTHAYQNAGTYNPTFTVSNSNGSVQTSASVVVSNNTQAVSFSASPTSGTAPLAVVFRSNTNGTVDFGDGTSDQMSVSCINYANSGGSSGNCTTLGNYYAGHTYTSAGTYTATLKRTTTNTCTSTLGTSCAAWTEMTEVIGTVTITVTGGTVSTTFSASPTSGWAPLGVVFTTNVSGALIDFGDGTSGKVSSDCATGLGGSTNCNTGSYFASHTYTQNGTYTATIKRIIGVREIFGGGDTNIYETIGTVTINVMTGWL